MALAAALGFAACGGDETCTTFAQVSIWPTCTACHATTVTGTARKDAPVGADFDVYESAAANAELAQSYVLISFMPPVGEPQPTVAQKASLDDWVRCGKPR